MFEYLDGDQAKKKENLVLPENLCYSWLGRDVVLIQLQKGLCHSWGGWVGGVNNMKLLT